MEWGFILKIFVKNVQYFSIKITDCSYKIYPIKSHALFTQATKILHSHNWPDDYTEHKTTPIDKSEPLFYQLRYSHFTCHVVQTRLLSRRCASSERLTLLIFRLRRTLALRASGLFLTDRVKPSLLQRLGTNKRLA